MQQLAHDLYVERLLAAVGGRAVVQIVVGGARLVRVRV